MSRVPVLDKGHVELVGHSVDFADVPLSYDIGDVDGDHGERVLPEDLTLDAAIARAARLSYQGGTKTKRLDAALIDHLMRHRHTSPFEMVELKFRVKAPLFVVQQILRHRTASLNQESARYSVIEDEFYVPELWRTQDTVNKQGSAGALDATGQAEARSILELTQRDAYTQYEQLLAIGVAREQARAVLPVGIYTNLVWKQDLHNLLHFLKLRLDPHAQPEIQAYAQAMYELVLPLAPATIASWENHVLNARTFSADEMEIIRDAVEVAYEACEEDTGPYLEARYLSKRLKESGLKKSRRREFFAKLDLDYDGLVG